MKESISIKEAFRNGFQAFAKRWLFWIGIIFFVLVLSIFTNLLLASVESSTFSSFILALIHGAISIILYLGVLHLAIKAAKNEPYTFKDFFSKVHLFFSYLWGNILFFLLFFLAGLFMILVLSLLTFIENHTLKTYLGLTLLAIDFLVVLYFVIKLSFWPFFLIEKEHKASTSLKLSYFAVNGYTLKVFLFYFFTILINLLGLLLLGIGLLVTAAFTTIAWANLYLQLQTNQTEVL